MSTEFKWNKPIPRIVKEATGGPKTLLFMANELKRVMDPYVPALNLALAQDVRTYVEDDAGIVHYLAPYARYQHEGLLMVSRITGSPWAKYGESKVVTGRKLNHNTSRHPLATSEWEKAAWTARGAEVVAATQKYIEGVG